ncbi:hypothetical protein AAH678_29180 [Sodalis endosymbiont of Spalangia cameroni]|uniref:hypothetical protein n=1 Tax=Sodalis praecaptivus TaxID=1239307 RepID=UPI0031F89B0E
MKVFEYLSCFHNNTTDKIGTNEYYSLKHNLFISEKAINTSREKRTSILKTDSLAAVKNSSIEFKTVKKVTFSDEVTIMPESVYSELTPPPSSPVSTPAVIGFKLKNIKENLEALDRTITESMLYKIQKRMLHHNNAT